MKKLVYILAAQINMMLGNTLSQKQSAIIKKQIRNSKGDK